MTPLLPFEPTKHPAEKLLRAMTGDELWLISDFTKHGHPELLPIALRHMVCNWRELGCHKPLAWDGIEGTCAFVRCYNCRGAKAYKEHQLANGMNVSLGDDSRTWFPINWLEPNSQMKLAEALVIEIPKEPVYKTVEVDDGHVRFGHLVELTEEEAFTYWARGFDPRVK